MFGTNLTKPWVWRVTNVVGEEENARDQTIKNIYSRLSIGLPGTPMPAHRATEEGNKDPVSPEDRWHIANYVYTLRQKTQAPSDEPVVRAMPVEGVLPDTINAEVWANTPAHSRVRDGSWAHWLYWLALAATALIASFMGPKGYL